MSNCSCGGSCGGSCGCNVGPQIKIHDLPKGQQIVTTVKHEDIPKPPKKETTPVWVYVLIVYFVAFFLWALKDGSYGEHPPEHYPPTHPPEKPYPHDPYSPCPIPKTPACPW